MAAVVALSESTTSLLAALLGALVGGAASLAGSIVVSRWSRSSDARLRLYEELIPSAMSAWQAIREDPSDPAFVQSDELTNRLQALRRASVVAGRRERHLADAAAKTWRPLQRTRDLFFAYTMGNKADADAAGYVESLERFESIGVSLEQLMRLLERRLD